MTGPLDALRGLCFGGLPGVDFFQLGLLLLQLLLILDRRNLRLHGHYFGLQQLCFLLFGLGVGTGGGQGLELLRERLQLFLQLGDLA